MCQNHEDDCVNFCGLLRKAELYRTKIVNCKLSVAFVVVLSTCSILSKHFLFLRFLSEQMDSFKKGNNFAVKTRRLLFRKRNLSLLRKKVTPYNNYVQKSKCSSQNFFSFRCKTIIKWGNWVGLICHILQFASSKRQNSLV